MNNRYKKIRIIYDNNNIKKQKFLEPYLYTYLYTVYWWVLLYECIDNIIKL